MEAELHRVADDGERGQVDQVRDAITGGDAGDQSQEADHQRLGEDRLADLVAGHGDDPQEAQLSGLLEDVHRKRVGDAERGDQQQEHHHAPQRADDAGHHAVDLLPHVGWTSAATGQISDVIFSSAARTSGMLIRVRPGS